MSNTPIFDWQYAEHAHFYAEYEYAERAHCVCDRKCFTSRLVGRFDIFERALCVRTHINKVL